MASSVVEIVNLALVELGQGLITSLEDPIKAASLAKVSYIPIRNAVLRAYPWNCAMKRAILAPDATAPIYGFTYRHLLPADCLTVREVTDSEDEYEVENGYLLYNSNIAYIKYTSEVDDVTKYDDLLTDAIVFRLANRLAMPLTQSTTVKDNMWENYMLRVKEARSVDAQEGSRKTMIADDWTLAHDGYVITKRNPA